MPGASITHELTEAYEGAKISQASGVSSPPSEDPGSVYPQAHDAATVQPDMYIRDLDSKGNSWQYYAKPPNGEERIIDTYHKSEYE